MVSIYCVLDHTIFLLYFVEEKEVKHIYTAPAIETIDETGSLPHISNNHCKVLHWYLTFNYLTLTVPISHKYNSNVQCHCHNKATVV